MTRKRKSDATRLDEVDRSIYTSFCSAANSLSQLYTQAMHQQRLSFQAGGRHALEKLYNWLLRQQEDGLRVLTSDILEYVQNELDHGTDDPPSSPRLSFQQQQQQGQPAAISTQSGAPVPSNAFGPVNAGQGFRPGNSDQNKNSIFSNALSSPVHRSLQHYQSSQGGYYFNNINRSYENSNISNQTRDPNPPGSNDTSMDMHADSPGQDSPY